MCYFLKLAFGFIVNIFHDNIKAADIINTISFIRTKLAVSKKSFTSTPYTNKGYANAEDHKQGKGKELVIFRT